VKLGHQCGCLLIELDLSAAPVSPGPSIVGRVNLAVQQSPIDLIVPFEKRPRSRQGSERLEIQVEFKQAPKRKTMLNDRQQLQQRSPEICANRAAHVLTKPGGTNCPSMGPDTATAAFLIEVMRTAQTPADAKASSSRLAIKQAEGRRLS